MINASVILDEAATTLLDTAERTWSREEKLGYLNEALRTTAGVKPDFYTIQDFVPCVEGIIQGIPDDGVALLKITDNSLGRVVTQVDESLLLESNRYYPNGTQEPGVEHYCADPRNPRRYLVTPPNDGQGSVRMLYGAIPPQLMYDTEDIDVPASYQNCLFNFVLSRCYAKNSARQDLTKSNAYMGMWGQFLGMKTQSQIAVSPKVSAQPGTGAA